MTMVAFKIPIRKRNRQAMRKLDDNPKPIFPTSKANNPTFNTNFRPYTSAHFPHKIDVKKLEILNADTRMPAYGPIFVSVYCNSSCSFFFNKCKAINPEYGITLITV